MGFELQTVIRVKVDDRIQSQHEYCVEDDGLGCARLCLLRTGVDRGVLGYRMGCLETGRWRAIFFGKLFLTHVPNSNSRTIREGDRPLQLVRKT